MEKRVMIGISGFVVLSWLSLFVYSLLDLRFLWLFRKSMYQGIVSDIALVILFCFLSGSAIAVFFSLTKKTTRNEGLLIAFASSLIGIVPILLFGNSVGEGSVYIWVVIFFIVGMVLRKLFMTYEEPDFIRRISHGFSSALFVFFFVTIGFTVGSYLFVQGNIGVYESEIRNMTLNILAENQPGAFLTEEDIKPLIEKLIQPDMIQFSRRDLEEVFSAVEMDTMLIKNYPGYSSLSLQDRSKIKNQLIDAQVNLTYDMLNDKAFKGKLQEYLQTKVDTMAGDVIDSLRSQNLMDGLSQSLDGILSKMPIYKTLIRLFPFCVSVTIFSLILTLTALVGIFASIVYDILGML